MMKGMRFVAVLSIVAWTLFLSCPNDIKASRNLEQKPYPWIYSTNVCPKNLTIHDRCYTPDKQKCNSTVCCIGLKPNNQNLHQCINDKDCTYFVHYEYHGPMNVTEPDGKWSIRNENESVAIHYKMVSKRTTPHYFAYALSANDKMGSDLSFVCELTKYKTVKFYLRWNHQRRSLKPKTPMNEIAEVERTEFSTETQETYCDFILLPKVQYIHRKPYANFTLIKDNNRLDKYYDLLVAGTVLPNGDLKYHEHIYVTGHINNRWTYTNQCIVTAGYPSYFQEKFHASYMIVAWIVVMPINNYIARYFKGAWNSQCFIFGPVWLTIHKLLSVTAFLMVGVGYVIASGDRNFDVTAYYPAIVHSISGFSSMLFVLIEFLLGACRIRFYSLTVMKRIQLSHSVFHFWVLFSGYVTIGMAPWFTFNTMPCGMYHAIYPFVIVQIAFHALMIGYHKKMDENLGYNPYRALYNYPLEINYPETLYNRRVGMSGFLLASYTVSSIGFGSLIITSMIFEDSYGPPCYPAYKHIPLAQRPELLD